MSMADTDTTESDVAHINNLFANFNVYGDTDIRAEMKKRNVTFDMLNFTEEEFMRKMVWQLAHL